MGKASRAILWIVKRSIVSVPVKRAGSQAGSKASSDQDLLAVEEPLQIRLGARDLAITMRTPGNDEELAVGFLFTEGILLGRDAIASVTPGRIRSRSRWRAKPPSM
jgi:formate dehydrogenase assembly factor FdhD